MKRFFAPNISNRGRLVRGVIALALLLAGISISSPVGLRALLILSAAFVAFEALRGWCALRACGIKTRL